jgi:hypothetical protein
MASKESKKGAARPKRSKEETQQEFARISEEVAAGLEATDAKTAEAARFRETQVRQSVDGIGVATVVQKISGLGLEVSRALADVSEKLTEEVQLLAVVREAVALERKELEHLHKIDVAATALDQLGPGPCAREAEAGGGDRRWTAGMGGGDLTPGARAQGAGGNPQEAAATRDRGLRVQEDPRAEKGPGQI